VGWNVQAFARGVGPGRLPDLRAHDATTLAQISYIDQHDAATTFVLAHDLIRQLHYYVPQYQGDLLFSEYVPDFQTSLTRTALPPGTSKIVVLDSPLKVGAEDQAALSEAALKDTARRLGLSPDGFAVCLADPGTKRRLEADRQAADELAVTGTPYFFINGRPLNGSVPVERFEAVITDELHRRASKAEEPKRG